MINTAIFLLISLLSFAGVIWLQLLLSKNESKFLGLILPIISFTFSLLTVMGIVTPKTIFIDTVTKADVIEIIGLVAPTLFITNISTIVLLAIYFSCRKNSKRKAQLEKMNIQDL